MRKTCGLSYAFPSECKNFVLRPNGPRRQSFFALLTLASTEKNIRKNVVQYFLYEDYYKRKKNSYKIIAAADCFFFDKHITRREL